MIDRDLYINWIKNELCNLLEDDIEVDVHDEFSYNPSANVDITVKFLPGQIQCGVPQYPCELLMEINEEFSAEVIKALTELTIDYNETLITLNTDKYRQYYTTPNVVGTFQNRGITNNTAVSISVSLISFTNVLMIERMVLSYNEYTDAINFVNFNFAYMVETNSTGAIDDPLVRVVGESIGVTFTITFVPKSSDFMKELMKHMLIEADANREYSLHLSLGFATIAYRVVLQAGTISQAVNGLPLLQVTFMRGDFNG